MSMYTVWIDRGEEDHRLRDKQTAPAPQKGPSHCASPLLSVSRPWLCMQKKSEAGRCTFRVLGLNQYTYPCFPTILKRVGYMRTFDNSYGTNKYILPLLLDDPEYEVRASIANMFTYLDDFMNTLMLELDRIQEDNHKLENLGNQRVERLEDRLCFTALWADYYFFLNTVERTYRLAKELYKKLGEHDKERQIDQSISYFNARKIRNKIEHLYENLSDEHKQFYSQHRSMGPKNEITIDGISFSASEDSLQLLYQVYDDISNTIKKKYIDPSKTVVDRIWNRIER